MLAERRRATDLRVIPAEELVGHRERLEFADAGIVEAADELARAHVRIAEDLGDIVYRPDGYLERIQLCNQVRADERRDEVMQVLTEKISRLTRAELIAKLDAVDVPVGPVNDVAEILADEHVRARRLVGSFDYPGVGEFKALAIPYKFLGWDNPEIGRPPVLGEHTEALLAELGYSRERIAALKEKRAI